MGQHYEIGKREVQDRRYLPAYAASGAPPPPPASPHRPPRPGPSRSSLHPAVVALIVLVVVIPILVFILGVVAAIAIPQFLHAHDAAISAGCENNLKQIGIILEMYMLEDSDSLCPPMSERLMMTLDSIYPEYMTDPAILLCPWSGRTYVSRTEGDEPGDLEIIQAALDHPGYFYLGYRVTNEEEARVFIEACRAAKRSGAPFEAALTEILATGARPLPRLGEATISEAEWNMIPVAFDRYPIHPRQSINVLYLDGHVANMPVGTGFPAEIWFLDALYQIAESD